MMSRHSKAEDPRDPIAYEDGDISVKLYSYKVDGDCGTFAIQWRGNGQNGRVNRQPFEKAVEFAEAKFEELKQQRAAEGHYIAPVSEQLPAVQETFEKWVDAVPEDLRDVPINKWGRIARARLLGYAMQEVENMKAARDIKQMKTLVDIIEILDPEHSPKPQSAGTSNVNIAFLSSGQLPPLKVLKEIQAGG